MQILEPTAAAVTGASTRHATRNIGAGLSALLIGAFFVWGAGFASAQTLHDTAHDMRHAFGFPCH